MLRGVMARLPTHEQLLHAVRAHRGHWGPSPPVDVTVQPAEPGQQSVWDFPRPPEVRPASRPVTVRHAGVEIAHSTRARMIVETAGAPVYYLPPDDVRTELLVETDRVTVCEWKGAAVYYDLVFDGRCVPRAAFTYPDPLRDLGQGYEAVAGWFAFHAERVDEAWVGDEQVRPQDGLYAGWITSDLVGPIKGGPGTGHW